MNICICINHDHDHDDDDDEECDYILHRIKMLMIYAYPSSHIYLAIDLVMKIMAITMC